MSLFSRVCLFLLFFLITPQFLSILSAVSLLIRSSGFCPGHALNSLSLSFDLLSLSCLDRKRTSSLEVKTGSS